MKKFVMILGIVVSMLWSFNVWANPFLVCSPTEEKVTHYLLKWDGATGVELAAVFICEDKKTMLKYNLEALSDGTHHVEVAAGNLWGQSAWVPFDFKSGAPRGPQGIGLSPE